ncbi:MAG TPA: hypothetical protein VFG92_06745 [Agromyces sp.]|nr:hypothetical protein [Agromyces sp.]
MNTTQNTQRIIATALIAVTAGFALSSCAGQRQLPDSDSSRMSRVQIQELRAGYLDLAERRAQMYQDLAQERAQNSVDGAQRRVGQGDFVIPATPDRNANGLAHEVTRAEHRVQADRIPTLQVDDNDPRGFHGLPTGQ